MLLIGWSLLEGIGAALIMPAIVALVASNFGRAERPRAYGLVAAAGAIAVAVGPLIGGLLTTYASWRWVFAGEVIIVLVILSLARRMERRSRRTPRPGSTWSAPCCPALGLGLVVFGILRAGELGLRPTRSRRPRRGSGLSPVVWLVLAGGVVLRRLPRLGDGGRRQPAGRRWSTPRMLGEPLLRSGLTSFFFQYLLQAGLFFAVPLFLSVALGLSAIATGVRLLPLSVDAAARRGGHPQVLPRRLAPPGRADRLPRAASPGIVSLVAALEVGAGPEVVTWPMLLAGLGIGALASQLGSVTVSSVPDEQSAEVGGLQNTVTNLGASIGTALAGAVLISALTTSFFTGHPGQPRRPRRAVRAGARSSWPSGVPVRVRRPSWRPRSPTPASTTATADAVVDENEQARLDGLRPRWPCSRWRRCWPRSSPPGPLPTRQPGAECRPRPRCPTPGRRGWAGCRPAGRGHDRASATARTVTWWVRA